MQELKEVSPNYPNYPRLSRVRFRIESGASSSPGSGSTHRWLSGP